MTKRPPKDPKDISALCAEVKKHLQLALHDIEGLRLSGYDDLRLSSTLSTIHKAARSISDENSRRWEDEKQARELDQLKPTAIRHQSKPPSPNIWDAARDSSSNS